MERLPFHQQLRRERERRSWSQIDVAGKIGVDVKTVNRWESGKNKPLPYYRQLICQLFEKTPEEFGLFEETNAEPAASSLALSRPPLPSEEIADLEKSLSLLTPPFKSSDEDNGLHHAVEIDWGEAPHLNNFYGRSTELSELKKWIVDDHCQIVAILGMGGVGKSTLTSVLVEQIQETFEYVFWRSLQNIPPLKHILKQCIQFLSDQHHVELPELIDEQIALLIHHLRSRRCLLVLDNVESILQVGESAGQYQADYEDYGMLLQRLGEMQHTSCLVLTSREKPREVVRMEGETLPV
ncbi:MAG: helix-turn-helix domain-containing protein, partial [Chloroflexi bacterium]|nr:helix-turn-helix domain-containing protein [Chloroflexota bacterium]